MSSFDARGIAQLQSRIRCDERADVGSAAVSLLIARDQ
jgi:hypothetical protein